MLLEIGLANALVATGLALFVFCVSRFCKISSRNRGNQATSAPPAMALQSDVSAAPHRRDRASAPRSGARTDESIRDPWPGGTSIPSSPRDARGALPSGLPFLW